MGMWVPSMAPAHWEKFNRLSKPVITSCRASFLGKHITLFPNILIMDEHVLWVIMQAVDLPTPNKCDIVRYSTFVASLQMVMATRFSTDTAPQSTVSCLFRLRRSLRHIFWLNYLWLAQLNYNTAITTGAWNYNVSNIFQKFGLLIMFNKSVSSAL